MYKGAANRTTFETEFALNFVECFLDTGWLKKR
jgi:hypothetical protein